MAKRKKTMKDAVVLVIPKNASSEVKKAMKTHATKRGIKTVVK